MKEKIFKNFSLKVLSVVCAIILWAIIVNVNDPNTGYTFSNVTVQLINTESLTDNGYTYEVLEGGKISVYVSGPKSVVTDLKASDIVATADLSKITAFADYADISVQIIKDGVVRTDVEATPKTSAVKLSIDNRVSQTYNINIVNSGNMQDGYTIVSQSIAPNTVRVTGSSSQVAGIDTIKAVVDISGFNSDTTMMVPITIYDIDDNMLSLEGLELSKTEVEYAASVQQTKNVPVKVDITGNTAEGYVISDTKLSTNSVSVAGNKQALDSINEIVITSDQIDVSSLREDRTFSVDLTKIVPQNVSVLSNKTIQVEVKLANVSSKNITIDLTKAELINVPASSKAVVDGSLVITVQGQKSVIDSLDAASIKMKIDLSGLTVGTHTVPIAFTLPEGCSLSSSYMATVTIVNTEQTTTQTTTAR